MLSQPESRYGQTLSACRWTDFFRTLEHLVAHSYDLIYVVEATKCICLRIILNTLGRAFILKAIAQYGSAFRVLFKVTSLFSTPSPGNVGMGRSFGQKLTTENIIIIIIILIIIMALL